MAVVETLEPLTLGPDRMIYLAVDMGKRLPVRPLTSEETSQALLERAVSNQVFSAVFLADYSPVDLRVPRKDEAQIRERLSRMDDRERAYPTAAVFYDMMIDGAVRLNGKALQPPDGHLPGNLISSNELAEIPEGAGCYTLLVSSDDFMNRSRGTVRQIRRRFATENLHKALGTEGPFTILTDEEANRPNVYRSLLALADAAGPESEIRIVMASHGEEGRLLLEPWKGALDSYPTFLSYRDMASIFKGGNYRRMVVVGSACHSEPADSELPLRTMWLAASRREEYGFGAHFLEVLTADLRRFPRKRRLDAWLAGGGPERLDGRLIHRAEEPYEYDVCSPTAGDGRIKVEAGEEQHAAVRFSPDFPGRLPRNVG